MRPRGLPGNAVVASGRWGRVGGGGHNGKHGQPASLPIPACCCFGVLGEGWGRHGNKHAQPASLLETQRPSRS